MCQADNDQFRRDRLVFSAEYVSFISDLVKSASPPSVAQLEAPGLDSNLGLRILQIGAPFAFEIIARAGDNLNVNAFPTLVSNLQRICSTNAPA